MTLPKVEKDRFITSQWDDLWAYVLDNAGSVNDGNDGVKVMLASPSWTGQLPDGISRVIQGESDILGTLTRTQLLSAQGGMSRVQEIQQGYKLEPLSTYLGRPAPAAAPSVSWPVWTEGDETRDAYWSYVALLLPFIQPKDADQPMYQKLASIGLERGKTWDPAKLAPEVRAAIQEGLEEARAHFKELQNNPDYDTAKLFGPREKIGTDYINRVMGVYLGIFGNVPEQSKYYSITMDSEKQAFDGSKQSYALTFAKDQIPPVAYFWSVTMYRLPERWLVDNPINRYSIGSSTPNLKKNPDGSLTLYFSASSPGKDKEGNWLPSPKGPFWMVLRTYGPGKPVLENTYQVPPVKPVN